MTSASRSSLHAGGELGGPMPPLGGSPDAQRWRRFTGLLWREHLAHGSLVLGYVGFWIIAQLVFLFFFHPMAVLVFGVFCAIYFATAFGGADARDRALEFTLALPATRRELLLARLLYGGGVLALFIGASLLAIRFEWVQAVWGWFVETGYTAAFPDVETQWYLAAAVVPFAVFSCAFALASQAADEREVSGAGWGAVMLCLVFGLVAMAGEFWWLGRQKGWLPLGVLFLLGAVAMALGYRGYRVRDAVSRPSRAAESRGGSSAARIGWGVVVALVILSLFALALLLVGTRTRSMS